MSFVFAGMSNDTLRDYPNHYHLLWEIIVNVKGEGTLTANGKAYPFREKSIICIPPRVAHFKQASVGTFRDVYLQLSDCDLREQAEPTAIEDDDAGTVTALVEMIQRIYSKREGSYKEICERLASAVVGIIASRTKGCSEPSIEHLTDRMAKGFTDPDFSVSDVVEESGYCSDHLRRLFRKHLDMSPLEYLTLLRLRHAKKLLRENGMLNYTVSDIGRLSGFADTSYFSKLFKKKVGVSPLEYMRTRQGERESIKCVNKTN